MGFVLILTGFSVYWNSLPAPFTFDDEHAIVINEQIRHLSTSLSPTEPGSPLAGRPLVSLTFAVNYALGGLNVRGYRLTNIAIHVLCALLLFAVVGRAFTARPFDLAPRKGAPYTVDSSTTSIAFASALIWMVHPLATEAVDYVSQRTELMMAAFLLLTLYTAQRAGASSAIAKTANSESGHHRGLTPRERGWLALSVVCCALGMACKETMVVAPIVVFLYDRTFVFGSVREALRQRWPYYAALCATWIVLVALAWSSPRGDSAGFAGASVSPWTYLLNQSAMIIRYLRLAIWPRGLVLDYGEPLPLTLTAVAPYAIAIAALLAVTIAAVVRGSAIGFLGAWFFLTLAPTSSIIPISTEVGAERRMYLPLMAIVVLGVTSVGRAFTARPLKLAPHKGAPYTIAGVVLIAALLSIATVRRNSEYLSGLTLWQTVLDRWPAHARAHRNLAAELKLAGRPDEEIVHLRAAVSDLPEIRNLLGIELLAQGHLNEAIEELQRFIRERPADPNVPGARAALGSALLTREDYEAARVQFATLLATHPKDADALSNLGIALAALGRTGEATRAFRDAVTADPRNGLSQRNLALHLFQQNDFDGAAGPAGDAVRLTPNDAGAHTLLGLVLIGQQKIDDAIAEFRASLALQPDDNDAAGYLQRTLRAAGRPDNPGAAPR